MRENWENPGVLFKLADALGNVFGFRYSSYIKRLGLQGNENLLDFGSGSGAGSKYLAQLLCDGGHLTCVDTSRYWMAVAQKRMRGFNNVTYCSAPLPELKLQGESFDAVYIHYALHEVPVALRDGIVREFSRILKPAGTLYIKEPQRSHDGIAIAEIRRLMTFGGFAEKCGSEKGGTFAGVYGKVRI